MSISPSVAQPPAARQKAANVQLWFVNVFTVYQFVRHQATVFQFDSLLKILRPARQPQTLPWMYKL